MYCSYLSPALTMEDGNDG